MIFFDLLDFTISPNSPILFKSLKSSVKINSEAFIFFSQFLVSESKYNISSNPGVQFKKCGGLFGLINETLCPLFFNKLDKAKQLPIASPQDLCVELLLNFYFQIVVFLKL